jgi:hypothetical protein
MKRKVAQYRDQRIITKFLFFPCKLQGELRWLEKTSILQEYDDIGRPFHSSWWNIRFIEDTVEKKYNEIYDDCFNKLKNEKV